MSDSLTLAVRCVRLSWRQLDALLTSLLLPVLLMVMFVELFGGAIHAGTRYVDYVVPGVLLLCTGFSSGLTAVAVCTDAAGGMFDRLRSMDVRGPAVLAGHVAASAARNLISAILVVAVALALGFHPRARAVEWLAATGIMLAFILTLSSLSAALGLIARSPEGASGITFLIMFLPYASSAFVPVHTMPAWLHGLAQHQPITPLADSLRGVLLGTPLGAQPAMALAWCCGITAVSVAASVVLFGRERG